MRRNKIFSNQRCVICNHVSHAEISDDFGEFSSKPFYHDEVLNGTLCFECKESYQDSLSEFEDDDVEENLDDWFDELDD